MKIKDNMNKDLLNALENRDLYFESIETEELKMFDDEKLRQYRIFKEKYNNLTQMEKDLFFLSTQMKKNKIAQLYGVSRSYITLLLKKIGEKL